MASDGGDWRSVTTNQLDALSVGSDFGATQSQIALAIQLADPTTVDFDRLPTIPQHVANGVSRTPPPGSSSDSPPRLATPSAQAIGDHAQSTTAHGPGQGGAVVAATADAEYAEDAEDAEDVVDLDGSVAPEFESILHNTERDADHSTVFSFPPSPPALGINQTAMVGMQAIQVGDCALSTVSALPPPQTTLQKDMDEFNRADAWATLMKLKVQLGNKAFPPRLSASSELSVLQYWVRQCRMELQALNRSKATVRNIRAVMSTISTLTMPFKHIIGDWSSAANTMLDEKDDEELVQPLAQAYRAQMSTAAEQTPFQQITQTLSGRFMTLMTDVKLPQIQRALTEHKDDEHPLLQFTPAELAKEQQSHMSVAELQAASRVASYGYHHPGGIPPAAQVAPAAPAVPAMYAAPTAPTAVPPPPPPAPSQQLVTAKHELQNIMQVVQQLKTLKAELKADTLELERDYAQRESKLMRLKMQEQEQEQKQVLRTTSTPAGDDAEMPSRPPAEPRGVVAPGSHRGAPSPEWSSPSSQGSGGSRQSRRSHSSRHTHQSYMSTYGPPPPQHHARAGSVASSGMFSTVVDMM